MAVVLTADLDPLRQAVRLTASGLPAGAETITIERESPSGAVVAVRGAAGVETGGVDTFVAHDWEAPLGVDLAYRVRVYDDGGAELELAGVDFRLPAAVGDNPWLIDLAHPLNSQPVIVESLEQLQYESPVGIHRVIDRRSPVLTSSPSWTPRSELVFCTTTRLQRDRARAVLGTGLTVLLRTPPEQGVGNLYLGVTGFVESRPSRIAQEWTRRFTVQVVQVDRPDPSVFRPQPTMTYEAVAGQFATYADLRAGVRNYDALAFSIPEGGVEIFEPWPPEDV